MRISEGIECDLDGTGIQEGDGRSVAAFTGDDSLEIYEDPSVKTWIHILCEHLGAFEFADEVP